MRVADHLHLPASLISGNIVITMQETAGTTISPFDPTNMAFNQVASASSAATNNYRYDTIELTLTEQASGDAADLTNIVQFGMPIELSANGQTRGFLPNVGGTPTGQALVTAMNGISPTGFQNGTWASGSTPLASPTDQRETYMGGNNGNSSQQHEPAEPVDRLERLRPGSRPGRPAHPHRQFLSRRRRRPGHEDARGLAVLRLLRREL